MAIQWGWEVNEIVISQVALRDLKKMPREIIDQLEYWIELVEKNGIAEIRKIKGYHDEPLQGDRKGQRSVRLSRSYRAIYVQDKARVLITIIEIHKHKY